MARKADGGGAGTISVVGGATATAGIQATRSSVVNSVTTGALSNGSAGPAFIFFSNTLISGNATALSAVGGGNLVSYKNNSVDGNFAPGAFTSTVVPE